MDIIRNRKMSNLMLISMISGLLAVFVFRRNLAAEASLTGYFGLIPGELINGPVSASAVTQIFRVPVMGFIYFNFFDIVNVLLIFMLFIPVFHAFYTRSRTLFVLSISLMTITLLFFFLSNDTLPLFLNRNNPENLDEILNNPSLQKILYDISIFLLYSFGLFMTLSMKSLGIFSRYTFSFGLLTNCIGLLYFPLTIIINELNYLAIVLAAPFTVLWHANIAFNINRCRRNGGESILPVND